MAKAKLPIGYAIDIAVVVLLPNYLATIGYIEPFPQRSAVGYADAAAREVEQCRERSLFRYRLDRSRCGDVSNCIFVRRRCYFVAAGAGYSGYINRLSITGTFVEDYVHRVAWFSGDVECTVIVVDTVDVTLIRHLHSRP